MFYNEYVYWSGLLGDLPDSYMTSFQARVVGCEAVSDKEKTHYHILLDHTVFFPEGGGQPGDRGSLNEVAVLNTVEIHQQIFHITEEPLSIGSQVRGEVDYSLRHRRMQLHSAEHLLCSLIHNRYGFDNVGFHMSEDTMVTFDVNGVISVEEAQDFELLANQMVYANKTISIHYPKDEELSELHFRSKLDFTSNVRLVTIEDLDVCACCAPHVKTTAEIGLIKILSVIPHRGGTRIEMTAGISAYEDYCLLTEQNHRIMQLLSAKKERTFEAVCQLSDRVYQLQGKVNALKAELAKGTLLSVKSRLKDQLASGSTAPFLILGENMDDASLKDLINEITPQYPGIVAGFLSLTSGDEAETCSYRYIISVSKEVANTISEALPALAKRLNQAFSGRGGGSPLMVQGQITANWNELETFFQ